MTPEEISLINLASSIILTIVTIVYVILTYKIINQTSEINEKQRNLITLPHFKCKFVRMSGKRKFKFVLINYSDNPAFDVDIFLVGPIHEDDGSVEDFKMKYLKEPINLTSNDDDFYGISDRLLFPHFPSKTQMFEYMDFPIDCDTFWVYIQYRNVLKTNFSQLFWFVDNGKQEYSLSTATEARDITEPTPRLEIDIFDNVNDLVKDAPHNLISENHEKIPDFLKEFLSLFSHSVNRGKMKDAGFLGCEERGTFEDL